jgi:hypothetical protein
VPAPDVLTIHAVPHPDHAARQAGFPLDHPYIEQCWSASVGPSCALLLRRLPVLWREREPAVVAASELSRSLGLGANTRYEDCRFWRTVTRLTQHRLAARPEVDVLEVYATVRPLAPRQLARLPDWSRAAHDRLLGEHLDRLATGGVDGGSAVPGPQGRVTTRLDRLERTHRPPHLGHTR